MVFVAGTTGQADISLTRLVFSVQTIFDLFNIYIMQLQIRQLNVNLKCKQKLFYLYIYFCVLIHPLGVTPFLYVCTSIWYQLNKRQLVVFISLVDEV